MITGYQRPDTGYRFFTVSMTKFTSLYSTMDPHNQCKNCHSELQGPICHQCGQPVIRHRWTTNQVFRRFLHQISDLEKGFLYTVKKLFTAPHTLIANYWQGITVKAYGPFRYALIWTALNLLVNFWLGIDEMLQQALQPQVVTEEFSGEQIEEADQQFDAWLNMLVLLLIPIKSLITKWFFGKHGQNYGEHLIMNTYILGQQALITTFTQVLFYFLPFLLSGYLVFNFLVGLIYDSYVFKGLFKEKLVLIILKAFLIGLLGLVAFFGLLTLFSSLALWIA